LHFGEPIRVSRLHLLLHLLLYFLSGLYREELRALRLIRAAEIAQATELRAHYSGAIAAVESHAEHRERLGAECERLTAENKLLKQAFLIQGRRLAEQEAAGRELTAAAQRLEQSNYIMRVQLAHQESALRQASSSGGWRYFGGNSGGPDAGLG
jgi:hypothetical protein